MPEFSADLPIDGEIVTPDGVPTPKFLAFLSQVDEQIASINASVTTINASLAAAKSLHKYTVVSATDLSWEKDPETNAMLVTVIGAGGGAGGVAGNGSGTSGAGQPGGGGAVSIKYISAPADTYAITIGAGGAGGASGNNNGSDGGDTTFIGGGDNITAGGGEGGTGRNAGGNQKGGVGGGGGGATGGLAVGGDLNIPGASSESNPTINARPTEPLSGYAPGYSAGRQCLDTINGDAGYFPGGGGGSAYVINVGSNRAGGDGADGAVIVQEFKL